MRAALFFRVIKHGRKIYNRERYLFLAALADVGAIPNAPGNYKEVKESFVKRAFPERRPKALPADDIRTAQIAASMFRSLSPQHIRGPGVRQ